MARRLDAAHAEAEALRVQVEEIRRRIEEPPAVRDEQEYVITGLGGGLETQAARTPTAVDTVPAPMFADIVLRETVMQAASLAAGLRRALSPEVRNRIRFEMRREVKRARKQRRADLRQARREWEARQRAHVDLDGARSGGIRGMNRGLWFVAGAGAGIYGMIRARRAAEALTVDGMRDRVGAAVVGARMFRDEVAQGRADAESGLRERLGLVPHGTPELTSREES